VKQNADLAHPFPLGSILVMALILRIAAVCLTLPIAHVNLADYVQIHDGRDYVAYARALDTSTLRQAHHWVTVRFPGFPVAVYFLGLIMGKSWGLAALILNIGGALFAIYLFDKIFKHRWATLYFSIFPPSWFLFSSINATEGFFLFVNLLGIYLIWNRARPCAGYLILGISALVRPFAAFVIAALLISELLRGERLKRLTYAILAALPMLIWLSFCRLYYGSFFHNVDEYSQIWNRQVFDLPFRALIRSSIHSRDIPKLALVWGTVAFGILAALLAFRNWLDERTSLKWTTLASWQILSLLFYCSLASSNPFTSIDRYILTALPAQMFSVSDLIPKKRGIFYIAAILTLLIVLHWNKNHFARLAGTL